MKYLMENNGFDNEETQTKNELFLQNGYKLNCSKMKIPLILYKICKIGNRHRKCAISRH